MANGVLGKIQQGLGARAQFEQLGAIRDEREQARLAAKQQELVGGLRRRGLGLGGGTPEQQQEARLELLSADPKAAAQFFKSFEALPTPEQDRAKLQLQRITTAADNVQNLPDEQLNMGLLQTSQAFQNSGDIEAAKRTFALYQENLTPPQLRARLSAISAQTRDQEKVIASREKAEGVGAQADFAKGKEFVTKDKDGNLTLNTSVFNKRTGKQEIERNPITQKLVDTLGDTGDEKSLRAIADAGGKAAASAKGALSVKAAQDAFKQVVTIDAGIKLLDEGIAELESGADVGILDKFLPSIKESSSRFDNVADRMGLQVVSSVTFGALSAGELKVAMDTAVPPNLDNKQLAKWFRDRQAAQTKLRGFYIDIAKQASEEGKTPAEIMIEIEDKKSSTNKKEEATAEIPTAPPSGRQGGELRVDAAGNRAFVFPDGSFEEI